ncbi:TfoX domain-containing protein [Streptococcus cristatus AS 1.3089]|nr:TfoX domain-containing protein [Streptococcus cristatus AS 1.3089]
MLHIKEVEDAAFLCSLIKAVYPALPAPKKKK